MFHCLKQSFAINSIIGRALSMALLLKRCSGLIQQREKHLTHSTKTQIILQPRGTGFQNQKLKIEYRVSDTYLDFGMQ